METSILVQLQNLDNTFIKVQLEKKNGHFLCTFK